MNRQPLARGIRHSDPWMRNRMERYCTLHPRSPSAVRRPQLSRRRGTFVVLLGHSLENGIVGIGNTIENALRAFDLQISARTRTPNRTALKLDVGDLEPITGVVRR